MSAPSTAARLRLRLAIGALLCAIGIVVAASVAASAEAAPGVSVRRFSLLPSNTQAGGHPDLASTFVITSRANSEFKECCNDAKQVKVSAPAGVIISPNSLPQCTLAQFAAEHCPTDSQVGLAQLALFGGESFFATLALYNLVPRPGEPGVFGFQVPLFKNAQYIEAKPRTGGDFGLDIASPAINHFVPISGVRILTWGVPADPSHDPLRINSEEQRGQNFSFATLCNSDKETVSTDDPNTMVYFCGDTLGEGPHAPVASNSPLTPLLRNPTTCGIPLTASLEAVAYDKTVTHGETTFPATTGCDQLSFNPSLSAQPTTTEADSPTGLDIELSVPQKQSPLVPSPSEIRALTVTLPLGFSINPNAADGKVSCSDAEARFGTEQEAACPDFSKIGSLEIDSAVLPGPLPGYVYLGDPRPGDRYRLILTGNGFGVHVKLRGSIRPDPVTGQFVTVFDELPQTPFEEFRMHFFGSERGTMSTPTRCGTYSVKSTFVPWDSALPDQSSEQFFTIDSGAGGGACPGATRRFRPTMTSGMADNTAAAHSAFVLDLQRPDGDQNLSSLSVTTPPGFSGTLAGIPYCPEAGLQRVADQLYPGLAEISSPACPAAAQIGTASAGLGAGSRPLYLPGKVYLAGPYRGAPLSLAVVTPSVTGPYDLGNVVVRAALEVDPTTAQITAISDPLPQIIGGIPLRLRSIQIKLDRPDFTLNPTHCAPEQVFARIAGTEGGSAGLGSHFQAANCSNLGFAPKLAIKVSNATRRAHPALTATLSANAGDANLSRVAVTLPKTELLDNAHIDTVCTRVQFAAGNCPAGSDIGQAVASTPLLGSPLTGEVYLASSVHELPDLLVALKGQIDVNLRGRIDTIKGRIRTSFESIPDAPITSFTLKLEGGAKGLLQNTKSLCGRKLTVDAKIAGQNGARADQSPRFQAPCGKAKRTKRHDGRAGRASR